MTIPSEILVFLNKDVKEFASDMKLYTAIQLFIEHKLSLGKASELAQMDKIVFMHHLNQRNIPVINYQPSELMDELNAFGK
jgi:predicted HTH domain antitoxin